MKSLTQFSLREMMSTIKEKINAIIKKLLDEINEKSNIQHND